MKKIEYYTNRLGEKDKHTISYLNLNAVTPRPRIIYRSPGGASLTFQLPNHGVDLI